MPPVLFWLDTLCIPVADALSSYRQKAIDSMAQIYAGANKVLVLDPDLQNVPGTELLNYVDVLGMHVKISPWMSRSWPLQEGAVATNLFFKLKDNSGFLNHDQKRAMNFPTLRLLDPDFDNDDGRLRESDSSSQFTRVWNELASRSTTQASDIHGIFAALVDLSAEEILALP